MLDEGVKRLTVLRETAVLRVRIAAGLSRTERVIMHAISAVVVAGLVLAQAVSPLELSAGGQGDDLPAWSDEHGGFALQSLDGARLLLIPKDAQPGIVNVALCSRGRPFAIRFDRRQAGDAGGRQTSYRFDELAGDVFRVTNGRVDPAAVCFLASDQLLANATVMSVAPSQGAGACVQRGRFARLRDRAVVHCWPIARLAEQHEVALVEFERRGTDALASLVFVIGTRTIFMEFPATFRREGEDLWRVDDGGVLSPGGFDVVCALQQGDEYILGLAWGASEGVSLSLSTSDDSDGFRKIIGDYWYQVPY